VGVQPATAVTDPRAYRMIEAELQVNVTTLARDLGIWFYHPYDSRRSEKGWPDLVLVGPGGALFRELKRESGRLTPEQRRVGSMLTHAGLNWSTWRPRDLLDQTIHRQLARIARASPV
jgi:hypothetical protein